MELNNPMLCEANKCPTLSGAKFNGVISPLFSSPQTLTCDDATMQYTFIDGGGMEQQISAIECVCKLESCVMPTITGIDSNPPLYDPAAIPYIYPNGKCQYSHVLTCQNPLATTMEVCFFSQRRH
uniref:Uncharacterized protein n=1 Tax=Panagrolaimus superbus TaxID=310955 RepID=A0A914Y0G6_9BILA